MHSWTQSRLLATLLNLLKHSPIPLAICLFIDGLDEFEGQEDTVIGMIGDLADQTHVKVCVSSRPLLAFEEAFSEKPSLRLQDLTFETIREYAEFKLSKPIQNYVSPNKYDRTQAGDLVNRIVSRADGVFLWAVIAIRDLYDGLQGIANIDELVQTLESLPSELGSLFMLILQRIKPVFKRDGAYFLQVAMYQDRDSFYDDRMDLCRLHFSHSQRELKDRPAHYENIATGELVTACHTLKTRLLSHTAGLLELTPPQRDLRIYGKREHHDPILFININFFHRTAHDFLLRNDEANSFLADYGCSEAQVRLSVARGTLAQVAHLSQGVTEWVDGNQPNPVYYPFLASLTQILKAEQILGAAQTNLMQSLDYESLALGYRVPAEDQTYEFTPGAFMMHGGRATSIDKVGMAAYVEMKNYVCEQLHLPIKSQIESRKYPSSFPNLSKYSRSKKTTATIAWSEFAESRNQNIDIALEMRSSKYRQALGRCLQWKSDDRLQTEALSENNSLVESYMLCCCEATCLDLARVLLRAGANPMVRVEPIRTEPRILKLDTAESFWCKWLRDLRITTIAYANSNGGSQGLTFHDQDMRWDNILDIYDTTKALLANGADINYQLEKLHSDAYLNYRNYLKGRYLERERFNVWLTASAMFVLEECFNTEPEFRRFASEIEPLVKRPTREIVAIRLSGRLSTIPKLDYDEKEARLSAEESEMLVSLIEKWEDTGRRDDLDALQVALERVWRAHHPGVEILESSGIDEQTTICDDEDNGDG